jgi:glycosyltransferase involved in cell wall biosynthesis
MDHLKISMNMNASKSPEVTIIIPNYNRGYCLDRTIQSVIDQTFDDWELIVVDNNSTDNSLEVIHSFKDDRILSVQTDNDGIIARSRNLGIRNAKGIFTAFLDSDDWWSPTKLEISIDYLRSGADLVYHDLHNIFKLPVNIKRSSLVGTRVLISPVFDDLLSNGNAIVNSSVVVRTDLIQKINGFSEEPELVGSEDFDGWMRLSKLTDKFRKLEPVLGFYWSGGGNLTSHKTTLSNARYLSQRYQVEITRILGAEYPGWLLYSLARASLALGNFADARKYSWLSLRANLPYSRKARAIIVLALALVRVNV